VVGDGVGMTQWVGGIGGEAGGRGDSRGGVQNLLTGQVSY